MNYMETKIMRKIREERKKKERGEQMDLFENE
jgi:hypothetical protein